MKLKVFAPGSGLVEIKCVSKDVIDKIEIRDNGRDSIPDELWYP